MSQIKTKGRPKGSKNGVKYLTVNEIIDKLGADCKLQIPISKKWWDNLL